MLNFNHKAKVFKDATLQSQLNNDGFVVLDFLLPEEVNKLLQLYKNKHPDGVKGFYTSTFSKDTDYRKEVDAAIQQTMLRGLENYFYDYRVHCGSFIVKGADEKSALKMHQDMTLVDESVFTGINIWIPLVDLTKENGAIEVLPRSHRLFKTYRGASLPDIYDGIEEQVHKVMKPYYLKAGQAIIFDQSIIHFSPANRSGEPRPVINTFITHKNAGIEICYWDKVRNNEIEIF
ncbi:MAG: phytanoyl-CoA dioxygenase family protein, partial [Bacteroidia bacterium]|nr:phytanoyl-CoA dioxygenase family protein [Bacteroidia bacterium]